MSHRKLARNKHPNQPAIKVKAANLGLANLALLDNNLA